MSDYDSSDDESFVGDRLDNTKPWFDDSDDIRINEQICQRTREYDNRIQEEELRLFNREVAGPVKQVYVDRCQRLFRKNLRSYDKLNLAIGALQGVRRGPQLHVFAMPKPRISVNARTIKDVKQYWVGNHNKFWQYAIEETTPVYLEECVLSSIPMPLFFDIEIKRGETDEIRIVLGQQWQERLCSVFKQHMVNLGSIESLNLDDEKISRLMYNYERIHGRPFSNEECKAGLNLIIDYVTDFLENKLQLHCKFHVVSGCRKDKLSFHIVTKDLLIDSTVRSMPLLVFEIARSFQIDNLREIIQQFDWDCRWPIPISLHMNHQLIFRIRAMMILNLVTFIDEDINETIQSPEFKFRVVDDSIFDESVYTPNHLLRSPGSCKLTTTALHPVTVNSNILITEERIFNKIFTPDDSGYKTWMDNLITGPVEDDVPCLTGMMPSESYPRSRSWHTSNSRSDVSTIDLSSYLQVKYESPLFKDLRQRRSTRTIATEERANLFRTISQSDVENAREIVHPDDIFLSESYVRKPFRLFHPGEFLFHRHGAIEERTASAKVFPGGFRCFSCNTTYIVPRETPFEEPYMFTPNEIIEAEDHTAYMPDIDWDSAMKKKFVIVNAPMGSGKTEQLMKFTDKRLSKDPGTSILVISFRELLARQQACRLGLLCYKDLSPQELSLGPPLLSICLNSIAYLPQIKYDYVILDECGLIRRHFLSATIRNLDIVLIWFKQFINKSNSIFLLQDGISTEDVSFYTEMLEHPINPLNREKVFALQFKKPIVIHPIQMSTNYVDSLINLIKSYKSSLSDVNSDGRKVCIHPFMVFCTSCVIAEFIVRLLRDEAVKEKANPKAIKGIWSHLKKHSNFCDAFGKDPNGTCKEIDVVVCTSVIGAGFSIDERFESFHAFFVCGILPFEEERQFIQRLRFVLKYLQENARRQSYIYIEKGRGTTIDYSKVLTCFLCIGRVAYMLSERRGPNFYESENNEILANTSVRIAVEKTATRSLHDKLWKDYGKEILKSEFVEASWIISEAERKTMQRVITDYMRRRKKDISSHVLMENVEDLSSCVSELEIAESFDLLRYSEEKHIEQNILSHFYKPDVWLKLLDDKKDRIASTSFRSKIVSQANSLINWLIYIYGPLVPDRQRSMIDHWCARRMDTHILKKIAHYILAKEVLFPLLSVTEESKRVSYLRNGGCMPFMVGSVMIFNSDFVKAIKEKMEDQDGDLESIKERKHLRRACYMSMMDKGKNRESCFVHLYDSENTKELVKFVKHIFEKFGMEFKKEGNRKQVNLKRYIKYEAKEPRLSFKTALCLKKESRERLLELFPILLETDNLSSNDKIWMRDCIEDYTIACGSLGVKPDIDVFDERITIQQRLGVLRCRMTEEIVIQQNAPEPIIGFDVPETRHDSINEMNSPSPTIQPNRVISPEEVSFPDEEDMISVEAIPADEQIAMANENLKHADEAQQSRLLDYASSKKHLPAPQYRNKEQPYKRCAYINDSAKEDNNEYEDDDDCFISPAKSKENNVFDMEKESNDINGSSTKNDGFKYYESDVDEDDSKNNDSDELKDSFSGSEIAIDTDSHDFEEDSDDDCANKIDFSLNKGDKEIGDNNYNDNHNACSMFCRIGFKYNKKKSEILQQLRLKRCKRKRNLYEKHCNSNKSNTDDVEHEQIDDSDEENILTIRHQSQKHNRRKIVIEDD